MGCGGDLRLVKQLGGANSNRLDGGVCTRRLLIYVLLITFEYKQAMTRRAPAVLPTTKLRRD